jgi:hypothetical protein
VTRFLNSSLAIVAVLLLAAALRAGGLADWSLWEDEETSLHFSQHPDKPFPHCFPAFFLLLHGVYRWTGVSVGVGRLVVAFFGLASIWLTYLLARRLFSRPVGVLAGLFLALGLGHLFWSQSIRYYTLELVLELLCLLWFFEGLESDKPWALVLASLAFAAAVLCHFSAILVLPVLVGYLALTLLRRDSWTRARLRTYLVTGLLLLIIVAFAGWQFLVFRKVYPVGSLGAGPPGQDLLSLGMRVAAYFGVPVIALGLLAPVLSQDRTGKALLFLLVCSLVPVLEVVVLGGLRLAVVTWYYILFALCTFAVLAGVALTALYERGWRATAILGGVASVLYYAVFLTGYYTIMHGDRPRWDEATACLREAAGVRPGAVDNPDVFANVPGVVAYYLGVPPAETMGHPLVKQVPARPPEGGPARDQWYVVEVRVLPSAYAAWLKEHCTLQGEFPARTGPLDRSLFVYHCPAASPGQPTPAANGAQSN